MKGSVADNGTPLVLLVNDEEWTTRSIESILRPEGYVVLTARSGRQALELVGRVRPDLLLLDLRLPDLTGIDLCSQLRESDAIRPSTPILLFSSGPIRRQDELDALRAGAWGILTPPFDPQELLARLLPFVSAKRDADEAREAAYLNPTTGFYNIQGLMRRVSEISADTSRSHRPLACLVLAASVGSGSGTTQTNAGSTTDPGTAPEDLNRRFGKVLMATTRLSDVVGQVGESEFVIVAPGTDQEGALRLAERLMQAAEGRDGHDDVQLADLNVRAGLYAVSGAEPDTVAPQEFLRRATAALREAQSSGREEGGPKGIRHRDRIRQFKTN